MTVYTNKQRTDFLRVMNDNQHANLRLNAYKALGFNFLIGEINPKNHQVILDAINTLSLQDRLELANKLLKAGGLKEISVQECFDTYYKFHINDEYFAHEDFLHEFITGDEGILDGLRYVFNDLTWSDLNIIFSYLDSKLDAEHWHSWYVTGYKKSTDTSWIIYFDKEDSIDPNIKFIDDGVSDFDGSNLTEVFRNIIYAPYVMIISSNEYGDVFNETWNSKRSVANFCVPNSLGNMGTRTNEYLDEYMSSTYGMAPVETMVIVNE
ncbi:hypothetical protein [uncultured Lactobacillus sp.]|uniref:hypothetical protein n=1 Tax=uncultured Lactobacillus sp. TaxID=153152 RepID=UPI0025CCE2EE|nr:hypothetical protein [uncultured Lactobacillus sp.]